MSTTVTVFRAADYETPLWAFPNLTDGRYNRAGAAPATQYLALHPMTPWAELIRNLDLRTSDEARALRLPIWTVRVELRDEPFDLTFDSVDDFAREPEDLVADDHTACRTIAAALHSVGVVSVAAPSAALPGTRNLIVLQPALVIDFHAEPFDPEDWPTALVARDGRCPEGLWEHVHYKASATAHPGLEAWRSGDEFVFEQPIVDNVTLHR